MLKKNRSHVAKDGSVYFKNVGRYYEHTKSAIGTIPDNGSSELAQNNLCISTNSAASSILKSVLKELKK